MIGEIMTSKYKGYGFTIVGLIILLIGVVLLVEWIFYYVRGDNSSVLCFAYYFIPIVIGICILFDSYISIRDGELYDRH